MSLELTGKQIQGLQQSLTSAFPNYSDLERMLLFEMDVELPNIVASGPHGEVAFDLIKWAKAKGRMEDLIVAARTSNDGNPDLRAFATEIGLFAENLPKHGGQLEAMVVKGVPFANVAEFRMSMRRIEAATCHVEDGTGKGWGTGFLVGKDVIMTNQHVVQKLIGKGTPQVRFGFIRDEDGPGVDEGTVVPMIDDGWDVVSSPPKELDFALLRLSQNAADLPFENDTRGFLKPDGNYAFKKDEPILVIQHPNRQPLQLGVGYLRDVNNFMKRIGYTANTEPGSSGSPCFSLSWDLIAIHHEGSEFTNHGTPMSAILKHLQDEGLSDLIG